MSMDPEEAKEILSLGDQFSKDELRRRYRSCAIKSHPDRNLGDPNASNKFQAVSNAYLTLLAQADKRTDRITSVDKMVESFIPSNLSKPPAVIFFLHISLQESYTGTLAPLEITRWIEKEEGKEDEAETIYVEVREGADNGEVIVMEGRGNRKINGICSDLKIFLKIKPDKTFEREGLTLRYTRSINLVEAYKGVDFAVQHLNGKEYVFTTKKVPIQSGAVSKIKDLGMKRDGYSGNLEIVLKIELEPMPDPRFLEMLENWFIGKEREKGNTNDFSNQIGN